MNPIRVRDLRASAPLLFAALCACLPAPLQAQFAALNNTATRYAGNSTGTPGYSSDSGAATSTSLNAPAYAVLDTAGNLFVSDTTNNCVRKIDPAGNTTTVAGLRVSGNLDTCNAALNSTPTPAQGLLTPTGLALDSAGTLYISDSGHNCVRILASGAVDSAASNALSTAAGTCTASDTASVTPVPNGLAVDAANNLYISIRDSAASTPVNQVLLHVSGATATSVCYLVGRPSAAVPSACSGITGTATLSSPAGLTVDHAGNLYIADTGNNCVRELAGLNTLRTAAGQCANDATAGASLLTSPYGLAVTPANAILITQSGPQSSVLSYSPATNSVAQIAGFPGGTPAPYTTAQEGQSALTTALNTPLGITTDTQGNIFVSDSANNIIRKLSPDLTFPSTNVGATSPTQTITFGINQASTLTASIGADYSITTNTCTGVQTPAGSNLPPATCQVTVAFSPTRPGARNSALRLRDSVSNTLVSVPLTGTGVGSLSLFTPGIASTLAFNLRTPIALSLDSAGDTYLLEQGNATDNADILFYPAGGGAPTTVVPRGSGIFSPTAMALDPAGNIFIADASTNSISRFGADGSVNTSYITGLTNVSALAIDAFDNLYIAQAGNVHNVIEAYAAGGSRIIAGAGSTTNADGVPAISAQFIKPSGLALGPNSLAIADASGQLVYTVDNTGTIHITAGNGSSISTNTAQATGTAMLYPIGLSYDAAGDLYIVDQSASRVYQVSPVQSAGVNISTVFGNGASGYSGDGGLATAASLQAPVTVALDGSAQIYLIDYGNSALREVTYSTVANINFGDVVIGNSSTRNQALSNLGNASLAVVTPITTTEAHYTVANTTTCGSSLAAGGICTMAYTFTPTGQGTITAQSLINSDSFNSPLTVNLTASGLVPQDLPYSLPAETEVYGQPFTQTVNLNLVYPDLAPTGTMSFNIGSSGGSGGLTTCSTSAPFSLPVLCSAPNSHLHASISPYNVNFVYSPDAGNINYHPATGTTTLTVTQAPLTVTPANVTKLYGAPVTFPNPAASITGIVPGDLITAVDSAPATSSTPVGSYQITTTLITGGATSLSDYAITYIPASLTIVNTALNVAVNNATRPYGAANPTFSSVTTGTQNGDTFTITYATSATTTSPVGAYPITAIVTGPSMGNYTLTVVAGTLTVTPIPLTVNVADATRTYGAANPPFSATVTGAINGDTFTQSLSTTAAQFSDVGTYPINDVLGGPAASNYTISVVPGHLTITPALSIVTVTAANATRTYGAANPTFASTVVGTINGDTVTVTYTTPANATSPVGSYPIVPVISGTKAADYTFATTNGTLTVTPAALVIAADNASRTYNRANPTFTGTTGGLLNGDTVTVSYSTPATTTSPVGTYPIIPAVTGAALSNYSLTATNGILTISPAPTTPLVVTVGNATRSYGAANPVFTGTVTGLLNGDVVTLAYTSAATTTSAPGAYPISATVSGLAAANYTLNVIPGTLAVTPAATTVGLGTSASPLFYGASVTFTATVNSAAGTPTGTVTFLNGSTILGTATIGANGAAIFSTSSLLPGNATITANYSGDADFAASNSSLTQVVSAGIFSLAATPASQFVRGAGSTVYTVTATSAQGFTGPITLACAGLPSDATCTFTAPILSLKAGGTATTTMTVTTTAADARLEAPALPAGKPLSRFAPIAFAAVFPFELTGLGVLFAGTRRNRRKLSRSPRVRVLLLVFCTVGLMGLAGCACFTSVYQNYTVTINGTTTVPGVASQSTSVILSVGQQ